MPFSPVASSLALRSGAQVESEARVRLVAGLKKYYHAKQREGLLSGAGTQILDWACSIAMDDPDRPLNIWQIVHRCCRVPTVLCSQQRCMTHHQATSIARIYRSWHTRKTN